MQEWYRLKSGYGRTRRSAFPDRLILPTTSSVTARWRLRSSLSLRETLAGCNERCRFRMLIQAVATWMLIRILLASIVPVCVCGCRNIEPTDGIVHVLPDWTLTVSGILTYLVYWPDWRARMAAFVDCAAERRQTSHKTVVLSSTVRRKKSLSWTWYVYKAVCQLFQWIRWYNKFRGCKAACQLVVQRNTGILVLALAGRA